MVWVLRQILLGIHILLAIIWVGGVLFVGWGVYPASKKLAAHHQRTFLKALMQWTHHLFTLAGVGVIITGVILGTVLGPLNSWADVYSTAYGRIWLTALISALLTLGWGVFISYRQAMKVFANERLWIAAENGDAKPLNKAMLLITGIESIEVFGFLLLIGCMILL